MLLQEILVEGVQEGYWYNPSTRQVVHVGHDEYGATLHVDILHDHPELFGLSKEEAGEVKPEHLSQSVLARKVFDTGWARVRSWKGVEGSWISVEGSKETMKHPNIRELILKDRKPAIDQEQEFAVFLDVMDPKTGKVADGTHMELNRPADIFKMTQWLQQV